MKKLITLFVTITMLVVTSCSSVKSTSSKSSTLEYKDSIPMTKAKILENIKKWSCKLTKDYKNYQQDIYDDQVDLPYKIYINCVVPQDKQLAKVSIEIEVVDSLLLCMVKCNKDRTISNKILTDFRNSF